MSSTAAPAEAAVRLDKWLWHARFFKTRSLASKTVSEGRVRVDGTVVGKPHWSVRPGQVLTFVQGGHVRLVKVVALGTRRGPAPEAQTLYEDLAPPSPDTALPRDSGRPPPAPRGRGAGRPTKKERRQTERLRDADP